ncbi:BLUF domain-containing protein [Leucothrix sargassi]|nr:BLUF domain-containing protein [Leucothrix sargassi]
MRNLMNLIYASKAVDDFSNDDIVRLLTRARKRNASLKVTGMLLYDSGSFFQVLEGDESVIKSLFTDIKRDPRHHRIVQIISEAIPKRQFAAWSMGYVASPKSDLEQVEGMNDFFTQARCLTEIGEGRAKKILKAFAEERWRLS